MMFIKNKAKGKTLLVWPEYNNVFRVTFNGIFCLMQTVLSYSNNRSEGNVLMLGYLINRW